MRALGGSCRFGDSSGLEASALIWILIWARDCSHTLNRLKTREFRREERRLVDPMSDEQRQITRFQPHSEGLRPFFRPAALTFAYAEPLHRAYVALLKQILAADRGD